MIASPHETPQIKASLVGRWMLSHVCYPSADAPDARSYPMPQGKVHWEFFPDGTGTIEGDKEMYDACYWLCTYEAMALRNKQKKHSSKISFHWEWEEETQLLKLQQEKGAESMSDSEPCFYRVMRINLRRLELWHPAQLEDGAIFTLYFRQ